MLAVFVKQMRPVGHGSQLVSSATPRSAEKVPSGHGEQEIEFADVDDR
jgi:hypothetical protein